MSTEPDRISPYEAGHAPDRPDADGCSACLEFDWAEEDAERVGDLSLATDWRILRRRHQAADHPAPAAVPQAEVAEHPAEVADHPAEVALTDSADAPTASIH